MRKKLISKTYLRGVNKYELKIYFNLEDCYISVKKIIDIKKPFILSNGLCVIDNNYYIMEVIPKNENYAMRVFFNNKKEILEYYFDVSLENGMDKETGIPYYDDLFIDVTKTKDKVEVLDEDELEEALDNNEISITDFELANKIRDILLEQINNGNNRYMNMNLEQYL
ncbi:MAG: DUF402 domain-containing protein [bacterium]|nr:DUF402 domain-containing protein [bacterium]